MKTLDEKNTSITFPIAIVVSRFNEAVTLRLVDGALGRLRELGFKDDDITLAWVPGAVEIPIVAQRMAQLGTVEAVLALGAVIRGDTDHYTYVCQAVTHGCSHVSLNNDIPVIFGVLTTENEEQAFARAGGESGNKGAEAVDAAIETVAVLKRLC